MENTIKHQTYTAEELETIHAIEAEQDWHHDAQARIAHADTLLYQLAQSIDTVPAHSREHAADLMDAVIDILERANRRFSPDGTPPTAQKPPF